MDWRWEGICEKKGETYWVISGNSDELLLGICGKAERIIKTGAKAACRLTRVVLAYKLASYDITWAYTTMGASP